jgi:hypothetical protein
MTLDEFLGRFPEVPRDLSDEPVLKEYVEAFGRLLAIYGIGLAKRDRTLARLRATLEQYRKEPATFACTLVPRRAPGTPRSGCA